MKKIVLLLFLFIVFGYSSLPEISNNTLNLKFFKFEDKTVPLRGDANIYWEQFLTVEELKDVTPTATLTLPSNWYKIQTNNGNELPRKGFLTLAIKVIPPFEATNLAIKLPPIRTAYRLYVDSTLITSVGVPGVNQDEAVPDYYPHAVSLPKTTKPFTLIFHISNFDNSLGGPWQPIYIGEVDSIFLLRNKLLGYDTFFVGALLFFAVVQLITFFSEKTAPKREIPFLIGYTVAIMIHIATRGEYSIYFVFQNVPPAVFVRLNYLAFFMSGVMFQLYLHRKFIKVSSPAVTRFTIIIGGVFSTCVLATPLYFHSQLIPAYQIMIFLVMIYQIVMIYHARNVYGNTALTYLILVLLLFTGAMHDIAGYYSLGTKLNLTPLMSVFVVLVQTLLVLRDYGEITAERIKLTKTLDTMNAAIERFVPPQLFNLLDTSVENVYPGLQKEFKTTVMTADIRGFTTISERMSPEMNFSFINKFLSIVIPIIEKHNGFINNFVGDQFTALFPHSSDNAIAAAIELQKELNISEQFSTFMINKSVYLGIGIDYGPVTIGVQGDKTRMENTLMGDTIVGAARLESLTKDTGTRILISQNILEACSSGLEREGRNLGYDYLERTDLQLFELFYDSDSADTKRKKRSRDIIEQVVFYVQQEEYYQAERLLETIPEELVRHDIAVAYLKELCVNGLERKRLLRL